jgi:hypothetical protein
MGLTGDPALIGEVGGIVIGGTILLIGLIFAGGNWLSNDKDGDSPIKPGNTIEDFLSNSAVSRVSGSGKGANKSRGKAHKKRKHTKKKR